MALTPAYLASLRLLPRGRADAGEIELLTDPSELAAAGRDLAAAAVAHGSTVEEAEIGEVHRDRYIAVFRDAVRFRTGRVGTYLRVCIAGADDGIGGVVVLVARAGRILFKRCFRHATRRWEIELPRGFRAAGTPLVAAALAEAREETGYATFHAAPIEVGRFCPDTGLLGHSVVVMAVTVAGDPGPTAPEEMESIASEEIWWSPAEIEGAVAGRALHDGITLAAWMLARSHPLFRGER